MIAVLVVLLFATTLVPYSNAKPVLVITQKMDRTLNSIIKVVQSKIFLRAKSYLEKFFSDSALQSLHENVQAMLQRYDNKSSPAWVWGPLAYFIEYTYMFLALLFGHNQVTVFMTIALTSIIVIPALILLCSFAYSVVSLQEFFNYISDNQLINLSTLIFQYGIFGLLIGMIVLPIVVLVLVGMILITFPVTIMDRIIEDFWDTLGAVNWSDQP